MEFLVTYQDFILFALACIISIICFMITFIRTGSVTKALKDFKEVNENMKFKTLSANSKIEHKQEFSDYVPDYVLNPVTNELERLEINKNIQAYIDSHVETALEHALEKFLPKVVEEDDNFVDYTQSVSDLGSLGEAMEIAEGYRERFNLPDSYSMSDIYSYVDNKSVELKKKLEERNKEVSNGKSEKKETE